jgi:hypothetical protein
MNLPSYIEPDKWETVKTVGCWLVLAALAFEIYYLVELNAWVRGILG